LAGGRGPASGAPRHQLSGNCALAASHGHEPTSALAHGEKTIERGRPIPRHREASWRSLCAIVRSNGEATAGLADLDRAEETVSEDNGGNRSSGEADVRGSIIALPRRGSNRRTLADAGDDDANALAQQLCEQVREFDNRPPSHEAGAKVVWLFR
jgi:hypothetical protein